MSEPINGTLVYSLAFHAGLNGTAKTDCKYVPGTPEADIWDYAWELGYKEKDELDVEQDVDGIGALFEPRD